MSDVAASPPNDASAFLNTEIPTDAGRNDAEVADANQQLDFFSGAKTAMTGVYRDLSKATQVQLASQAALNNSSAFLSQYNQSVGTGLRSLAAIGNTTQIDDFEGANSASVDASVKNISDHIKSQIAESAKLSDIAAKQREIELKAHEARKELVRSYESLGERTNDALYHVAQDQQKISNRFVASNQGYDAANRQITGPPPATTSTTTYVQR